LLVPIIDKQFGARLNRLRRVRLSIVPRRKGANAGTGAVQTAVIPQQRVRVLDIQEWEETIGHGANPKGCAVNVVVWFRHGIEGITTPNILVYGASFIDSNSCVRQQKHVCMVSTQQMYTHKHTRTPQKSVHVIVTAVMIGHVGKGHHGIATGHLIAPFKVTAGKTAQSGARNGAGGQINATGIFQIIVCG
jgi:hypothetical protein